MAERNTCLTCGQVCGTREVPMHALYRMEDGRRTDIEPFCSVACATAYIALHPTETQAVPRCAKCGEIIVNMPWYASLSDDQPRHPECTPTMAEQYAGWTVYAGEATEDNILGAEAANYDIEESLSHYETQVALAIQEAFPGIEVQHENYPGTLGGNAVACDAEGRPDDGVDGISATIDSIIAEMFESGEWAVEKRTTCAYCGAVVPDEGDTPVPAVDDGDEWLLRELLHKPGCEWIATRAHRINYA